MTEQTDARGGLPGLVDRLVELVPARLRRKSAVEEAKTYLINTATPGYTMLRQGVAISIERLHPGFLIRLAEAGST